MTDDEALARVRAVCLALDGAEESVLQDRPLFNGESSPPRPRWAGCGRSLHFLADADEAPALRADRRFAPSPHHDERGWLALRLDDGTDWDEVAELLRAAHAVCSRPR